MTDRDWWRFDPKNEWSQNVKIPELFHNRKTGRYRVGETECDTRAEALPLLDGIYKKERITNV